MRLVRVRTMLRNGVHAIALNYRLTLGRSLFTRRGLAQLRQLSLPTHTAYRREETRAISLVGSDRGLAAPRERADTDPARLLERLDEHAVAALAVLAGTEVLE